VEPEDIYSNMNDTDKAKDMIKDLNKLITYLNEKDLDEEADNLSEIMRVAQMFERAPFDDNVKVAASYPGNMGVMEMFQFQREATPAQKKIMDRLLDEDRTSEAWEFLKKTTGVDLVDPPEHTPSRSQKVIETIEGVKIYRDTDWAEYIVVPEGGTIQADGYHTDDLEDAVETAKSMARKG
jgi:hypothetical protein